MRGGRRDGGGRPSKFKGATKTIRLPEALHQELVEIAHKLEAGEILVSVTELQEEVDRLVMMIPPGDRKLGIWYYKKLMKHLSEVLVERDL